MLLKKAAEARLSLHLSKCHIVGNNMSRLTSFSADQSVQTVVRAIFYNGAMR